VGCFLDDFGARVERTEAPERQRASSRRQLILGQFFPRRGFFPLTTAAREAVERTLPRCVTQLGRPTGRLAPLPPPYPWDWLRRARSGAVTGLMLDVSRAVLGHAQDRPLPLLRDGLDSRA
jgi:hypothetical protein